MESDSGDWPRDVMVDLMMHLSRDGYGRTSEYLADALMVFETERAQRRLAVGAAPAPALRLVAGGE